MDPGLERRLVAEILAFIDTPSRRGLIHAAVQDEDDVA